MPFADRTDAGIRLGIRLITASLDQPVVLALPRGGVPVGYEVARTLGAPLDVIAVRKLGVPTQPELAMGAIGEDGARLIDERVLRAAGVTMHDVDEVEARERPILERRMHRIRSVVPLVDVAGYTAVIVDDGMATGSTASVACQVVRSRGAARVVVAVPVAPPPTLHQLESLADQVVAVEAPASFQAVGQ